MEVSLQTEIAHSTIQAEYAALSASCKDLFPMLDKVKELSSAVSLSDCNVLNMHISVHEDNVGVFMLQGLEPHQMSPRFKHYAIK